MVLPLDSLQSACAGGLGRLLLSCWANVRVLRQRIRMEKMVARLIMEDLLCHSWLDATNLDYAGCRRLATARVPRSSVARAELFALTSSSALVRGGRNSTRRPLG